MPKTLSEKCCARCGFLYGLADGASTSTEAVFDPDLIRSPDYPQKSGQKQGYSPSIIASRPYTKQVSHHTHPRVNEHTWSNTKTLCCYLNKIDPLQSIGPVEEPAASPLWKWIEDAIRSDRESCDGFFSYHPGYTAAQHSELRLEEQRAERAEAHEKMLAEWSIEQEERLTKWADSQEDWRRKLERRWMVVFGILGLIYTALGWIVGFLMAGR
jgi:hypothetical protein